MKTKLISAKENKSETIFVNQDTQFVLDSSPNARFTLELVFERPGVLAEIIALYHTRNDDLFEITTITDHRVPNTSCNTFVRGVLSDNASSKYVGKILIRKPAQQTSSFLEANTLINGIGTHNNSQPILEIEADDVKASHGSTTGRIDVLQIYYLMSRGFSRTEAENLIIQGFFSSILSRIKDEKIKSQVSNKYLSFI